ncbi:hypothetical protein OIU77_015106 [Salix suchowensis]|uniref:Uncharacterized protein n=1 Tax=Salix suchowensis TaxID=1278906 RepID=A0ABQ8ZTX6_9ROSI|nr:hypothetical protein OIU77_015106 [Salix suchowensis]
MGYSFGWRAAASFLLLGAVMAVLGGYLSRLVASLSPALGRLGRSADVPSSSFFPPALPACVRGMLGRGLCVCCWHLLKGVRQYGAVLLGSFRLDFVAAVFRGLLLEIACGLLFFSSLFEALLMG